MTTTRPFGRSRAPIALASAYAGAALLWAVAGSALPGGRWLAIHLFTLGTVTTLLLALIPELAKALLHVPDVPSMSRNVAIAVLVPLTLVGVATGRTPLLAAGATGVTAAIVWVWADLRRWRRQALPSRYAWTVRAYERACGAGIHAALLGLLLGATVLPGQIHAGARLAHIHLNVLGWVGVVLLATIVTLGPATMRVRMEPDAAERAARALRVAVPAVTVSALALLGAIAEPRLLPVAALAVAVYAVAAGAVLLPVVLAATRAHPAAAAHVVGAATWFLAGVLADVVVLATARWTLLPRAGAVLLLGGIAQAIVAVLAHLVVAAGRDRERRDGAARVVRVTAAPLAVALNVGVAIVATTGATTVALAALAAEVAVLLVAQLVVHLPDRRAAQPA